MGKGDDIEKRPGRPALANGKRFECRARLTQEQWDKLSVLAGDKGIAQWIRDTIDHAKG